MNRVPGGANDVPAETVNRVISTARALARVPDQEFFYYFNFFRSFLGVVRRAGARDPQKVQTVADASARNRSVLRAAKAELAGARRSPRDASAIRLIEAAEELVRRTSLS